MFQRPTSSTLWSMKNLQVLIYSKLQEKNRDNNIHEKHNYSNKF